MDADKLAQIIREVDGNHSLGAGALAEAILAHPDTRALTQAQPGWRGIESAPRDGAEVLTWHAYGAPVSNPNHPHYGKRGHAIVQASISQWHSIFPSALVDSGSVTHWMPLPAAPAPQQGEGEQLCRECGQPTMHIGSLCYGCTHPQEGK